MGAVTQQPAYLDGRGDEWVCSPPYRLTIILLELSVT